MRRQLRTAQFPVVRRHLAEVSWRALSSSRYLGSIAFAAALVPASAWADGFATDTASLNAQIAAANASASAYTITIQNDITLTSALAAINNTSGATVTIKSADGNAFTINGANTFQIFTVNGGLASFENLTLANGLARGRDGMNGQNNGVFGGGGGGGGLGAGGGLFVAAGASVDVSGVGFAENRAVGGNGGATNGTAPDYAGAQGGGLNGAAGAGGGAPGGSGGSGVYGAGGGGGGGGVPPGAGGPGGAGGFGAGGGGGGGGFSAGGSAGAGGVGGGNGGNAPSSFGGGGGGGAGFGGAIFVAQGGFLTLSDSGIASSDFTNAVAGGSGGGGGGQTGGAGSAAGQAIYLHGTVATISVDAAASPSGRTYAGTISGNGGLIKQGGGLLALSAANSFTGDFTLDGGTVSAGDNSALGSGSFIARSGTLDIQNGITLSNAATLEGNIAVNVASSASGTYAGLIGESGGAFGITKTGAGTLVLTAANGFTGDFTLDGGTVRAEDNSALGSGLLLVKNGTLDIAPFVSIGNTAVLENNFTINVEPGPAATYSGDILESTGSFGVTKTGDGTLALSGANNYSGATIVNGGTLLIQSDGALPNASNVTVNADATLEIEDGFVEPWIGSLAGAGKVVIRTDSTLTIGFNPVATVFSGSITGNGSLAMEGPGQLTLTGASSIGGALIMCSSCTSSLLEINGGSLTVGDPLGGSGGIGLTGGTLRVVNGGTLHMVDPTGVLAVQSIMEVSGAGSTVTSEGFTGIGGLGAAGITISAGGVVNSKLGAAIAGLDASSMVTVTGAGSTWNVDYGLSVGSFGFGTGTIVISAGGVVNSTAFTEIGSDTDPLFGFATASVTVTGTGSTLNADNGLIVGLPGCGCGSADYAGILTIADGGTVNAAAGTEIGALGTLNLGTGGLAGSLVTPTLSNDGRIVADFTDSATLAADISGSGTLTKQGTGTLILSGNNSYTGTTFLNGGSLSIAANANLGDVASELAMNGGILRVTGTGLTSLGVRPFSFGAAGGGFDIADAGNSFAVAQSLSGAGSLAKLGSGTLLLASANSYTGATHVAGGTLQAGAAGAFSAGSAFTVDAGGRLVLAGLDQSIGSLAGAGSVDLGSARLTAGGNNASTLFSGVISGTGSLVKQGAGTLTLTGANTYTGGTTISGGTLVGTATSLQGAILNNAALVFDQAVAGTFAGAISGSGTLTKQGAGTLTLAGTNTYSGGTTISGGTLIGDSASLQGAITNNAALVFDQTSNGTFSGVITGSGTLAKQGGGVLMLTGTNLYTGTTFLNGGVLSVTSDANLGAASAALAFDGGALRIVGTGFDQSGRAITLGAGGGTFDIADAAASFTLAQSITSTGSLTKQGAGTLTLTGANSYAGGTTISAGTLVVNSTSLQGPILNNAALVFDQASAGTFAGAISGTGTLTKQGAGALNLTGTSTMSGPTTVTGGLLAVNGSLANSVVTLKGGTVGGNGTVGGIVAGGGTVAPGNSIGTLNVAGNVSFAAGTTYQVELNGTGASDRIVASGAATISGGQVQVLAANGAYAQSTRYSILTAQGGVSGQFAGVTSDLAFLAPSLSYDPTAVVLTMTRNETDFASVAATRNQGGVAIAAQSLGTGNRVYDALLGTTADQARAGFDLLSGEVHAQAVSVAIENSHLIRDSILNRLRAPYGSTAAGGSVSGGFTADLPGRKSVTVMPAPAFDTRRFTLWGEAIGAQGSVDRDGNAASLSYRGGGMLFGAELEQGQWRLGAAGGNANTDFDVDARRSNGELSSFHGALYGGARLGAFALRAGAAYSWNDVAVRRSVAFPGFSDYLRLDGRSAMAQAFAEIGYGLTFGQVALEPFAQIAAVNIRSEREGEQGGAAALTVLGRDQTLGFTTLGLRGEMQFGSLPLVARGMLGWRYAFGDITPTADLAFLAGGLPFQAYAAPVARNTLVAETGLAWKLSGSTTLGISYGAAVSDKARNQAVRGRIDIAF